MKNPVFWNTDIKACGVLKSQQTFRTDISPPSSGTNNELRNKSA